MYSQPVPLLRSRRSSLVAASCPRSIHNSKPHVSNNKSKKYIPSPDGLVDRGGDHRNHREGAVRYVLQVLSRSYIKLQLQEREKEKETQTWTRCRTECSSFQAPTRYCSSERRLYYPEEGTHSLQHSRSQRSDAQAAQKISLLFALPFTRISGSDTDTSYMKHRVRAYDACLYQYTSTST